MKMVIKYHICLQNIQNATEFHAKCKLRFVTYRYAFTVHHSTLVMEYWAQISHKFKRSKYSGECLISSRKVDISD